MCYESLMSLLIKLLKLYKGIIWTNQKYIMITIIIVNAASYQSVSWAPRLKCLREPYWYWTTQLVMFSSKNQTIARSNLVFILDVLQCTKSNDMEKVLYSVWHNRLILKVKQFGTPTYLINLVVSFLRKTSSSWSNFTAYIRCVHLCNMWCRFLQPRQINN